MLTYYIKIQINWFFWGGWGGGFNLDKKKNFQKSVLIHTYFQLVNTYIKFCDLVFTHK